NPELESVIQLLKRKGAIAIKLVSGSKGVGFYKISFKNNKFFLNDEELLSDEFIRFLDNLDGYILTEYILAHTDIRKVYSASPNAIRVGVFNDNGPPEIFGAFIRFGTKKSGLIEHAIAGGVFCGINIKDGTLFKPKRYHGEQTIDCPNHPDTGIAIKGKIPHWEHIKNIIQDIGNYVPQLKYIGYDIVITEHGFKILEINSHQSLTNMQPFYPLLQNDKIKNFFVSLNHKKNI